MAKPPVSKADLKRIPDEPTFPEQPDDSSWKEAQILGSMLTEEQIKAAALHGEHRRTERFRDHIERITISVVWLIWLVIVSTGLVWFWHIIMPVSLQWLSPDRIAALKDVLTIGVIATFISSHVKKRMGF